MDLKGLKEILNGGYPDDMKRQLVIKILADDEQVIPDILNILEYERKRKKKLVEEMNFQLSRAHIGLEKSKFAKTGLNGDHFIEKEIGIFYHKFKDQVGHCFKKLDDMKPEEIDPINAPFND
jgi:hypothetical protein